MPSLTGTPIQIIAVVLAVLTFLATMWLWPKLAGRGWRSWTGRVGAFLAAQVALLVAMGLVANSYFGFYTTWSDLLGTDGKPGTVVDQQPGKPVAVQGEQKVYSSQGSSRERSGLIQQVEIKGATTGISSAAYVYLPPQYFQPGFAERRFPMALVLAGYPGSAEKLISLMAYPASALAAVEAGKLPPTVLVMMRPTVVGNRDTECIDIPNGPQVETYFTEDLPKALASSYRVSEQPAQRAVIGNSTGGYCALKFALRKPDSYRTAISLSGYYSAPQDATTGDLFGGDQRLEQENDLLWRLRNTPPPAVSLLLATSYNEYNYPATQQMVAAFRAPTKVATITLDSGGHNFHTWTREIPPALEWLGRQLTPVQPV
ncbi:alpha/beta hydrolase-fold protein [Kitasatospora sp. NPDC002040]|uniref:alpha/beta hydrolase n=1 Tax=Kitasatospora sp. NPDC002040 TaxID=3154661 RepID=UPI0033219863